MESQMRELIYTDAELVVTPIIDNPKVRRGTPPPAGWVFHFTEDWSLGDVCISVPLVVRLDFFLTTHMSTRLTPALSVTLSPSCLGGVPPAPHPPASHQPSGPRSGCWLRPQTWVLEAFLSRHVLNVGHSRCSSWWCYEGRWQWALLTRRGVRQSQRPRPLIGYQDAGGRWQTLGAGGLWVHFYPRGILLLPVLWKAMLCY